MAFLKYKGVGVTALAGAVPQRIVNNYKYSKEDQDYTVKQSKENKTVQE